MDETNSPVEKSEVKCPAGRYESALQLVFYEGQISWQMNVLFVGLNIGIGTILQNKLDNFSSYDLLTIIMSIIGLVINLFWLGTFNRNNKYYEFRMAQARNAEPKDYKLVASDGFDFSIGKTVSMLGQPEYKLSWIERNSRNKISILVAIVCFIIGFTVVLILSFVPCLKEVQPPNQNKTAIQSSL